MGALPNHLPRFYYFAYEYFLTGRWPNHLDALLFFFLSCLHLHRIIVANMKHPVQAKRSFFHTSYFLCSHCGCFAGSKNRALSYVLLNPGQFGLSCRVKPTATNHSKDKEGTKNLAGISKVAIGVACYVWPLLRSFSVCLGEFSPKSMLEIWCQTLNTLRIKTELSWGHGTFSV